MKKRNFLTISFAAICVVAFSQTSTYSVDELVKKGIEYHDAGEYDKAIAQYEKALAIDAKSAWANYELSYTLLEKGDYSKAIKYSKTAIQLDKNNSEPSYIVLGTALDLSGSPAKAVKEYENGIKITPNSNLLNYNLALTAYNLRQYDKAEKALINAISAKPSHSSSHLLLSSVMMAKGQKIKAILPLYYFLTLEPNSNRSLSNCKILKNLLTGNVQRKDEKNVTITLNVSSAKNQFSSLETMLSMAVAARYTEKYADKNEYENFAYLTERLFGMLSLSENKDKFWDIYIQFFYENIKKSELSETLAYYISQSTNEEFITKWLNENEDKVEKLKTLLSVTVSIKK